MAEDQDPATVPTYLSAHPADSTRATRKQTLIGMIVATKTATATVTDTSMDFPPDYVTHPRAFDDERGHREDGRTICIHSFGVLTAYQRKGLGKVLMKSYQQRMETSGMADRIALLAHQPLVGMYTEMGFENRGRSAARFGGGGWTDLV